MLKMYKTDLETNKTEETKEEELVISDTAVRYDFPSENLLQYAL